MPMALLRKTNSFVAQKSLEQAVLKARPHGFCGFQRGEQVFLNVCGGTCTTGEWKIPRSWDGSG